MEPEPVPVQGIAHQTGGHGDSASVSVSNSESAERPSVDLQEQDGVEGVTKLLASSGLGLEKVDGRLKSFTVKWRLSNDQVVSFPSNKEGAPTPEVLSKVGFYFFPDSRHMDR